MSQDGRECYRVLGSVKVFQRWDMVARGVCQGGRECVKVAGSVLGWQGLLQDGSECDRVAGV